MPRLTWHLEEPRVGQSYPNFYAAQLASKFVKVVLSGAGGRRALRRLSVAVLPGRRQRRLRALRRQVLRFWQRLLPNKELRADVRPDRAKVEGVSTRDIFRDVFPRRSRADPQAPRTTSTTRSTSRRRPSCTACWWSRTSSRWRTASRRACPFLDNDLVDFAQRVPVGLKLGNLERGRALERERARAEDPALLRRRRATASCCCAGDGTRYVPEDVTGGAEAGLPAPDASWFRGESIDYVRTA